MKNLFFAALTAVILGLGATTMASTTANAQEFTVNGKPATVAQAEYLVSHGFAPGDWVIDGWGIAPAVDPRTLPASAQARVQGRS